MTYKYIINTYPLVQLQRLHHSITREIIHFFSEVLIKYSAKECLTLWLCFILQKCKIFNRCYQPHIFHTLLPLSKNSVVSFIRQNFPLESPTDISHFFKHFPTVFLITVSMYLTNRDVKPTDVLALQTYPSNLLHVKFVTSIPQIPKQCKVRLYTLSCFFLIYYS